MHSHVHNPGAAVGMKSRWNMTGGRSGALRGTTDVGDVVSALMLGVFEKIMNRLKK
jgi:hypothetical protein